jgi:hypothetical protein
VERTLGLKKVLRRGGAEDFFENKFLKWLSLKTLEIISSCPSKPQKP